MTRVRDGRAGGTMSDTFEAEMDGVRVNKSVETDDGRDVLIRFRVDSKREEAVEIRLRDHVPDGLDIQVPSGEVTRWRIDDGTAEYERHLEPAETVTTAYRLDVDEVDELDDELAPPGLVVTEPAPAGTTTDRSGADEEQSGADGVLTRGVEEAVFDFGDRATVEAPDPPATERDGAAPTAASPSAASGDESAERDASTVGAADEPTTAYDSFLGSVGEYEMPGDEMGVSDLLGGSSRDREADESDADAPSVARDGGAGSRAVDERGDEHAAADDQAADDENDEHAAADDDQAADDENDEHAAADDENDEHAADGDEADGLDADRPSDGDSTETRLDEADDVVETFIRRLDDGLSEDDAERLRRGLSDALVPRSSLDVRVMYLQSRFQELAAYIDAMKAFIDEHGSGEGILAELTEKYEAIDDELAAIERRLEDARDDDEAVHARLESVETRFDTLADRVDAREAAVDDELATLSERAADLEGDLTGLRDRVDDREETVQEEFGALRDRLDDREVTVDERLSTLADRVETLEADQRETEADVDELVEFQRKLQDAI